MQPCEMGSSNLTVAVNNSVLSTGSNIGHIDSRLEGMASENTSHQGHSNLVLATDDVLCKSQLLFTPDALSAIHGHAFMHCPRPHTEKKKKNKRGNFAASVNCPRRTLTLHVLNPVAHRTRHRLFMPRTEFSAGHRRRHAEHVMQHASIVPGAKFKSSFANRFGAKFKSSPAGPVPRCLPGHPRCRPRGP